MVRFFKKFGYHHSSPSLQQLSLLVNTPLTNFKKVIENLNMTFCSKKRKAQSESFKMAMTFPAVKMNQTKAIDHQLSSIQAKLVAQNSLKLCSIFATVC